MTHDLSHGWSQLKIYASEDDQKHILIGSEGSYTLHDRQRMIAVRAGKATARAETLAVAFLANIRQKRYYSVRLQRAVVLSFFASLRMTMEGFS